MKLQVDPENLDGPFTSQDIQQKKTRHLNAPEHLIIIIIIVVIMIMIIKP